MIWVPDKYNVCNPDGKIFSFNSMIWLSDKYNSVTSSGIKGISVSPLCDKSNITSFIYKINNYLNQFFIQ